VYDEEAAFYAQECVDAGAPVDVIRFVLGATPQEFVPATRIIAASWRHGVRERRDLLIACRLCLYEGVWEKWALQGVTDPAEVLAAAGRTWVDDFRSEEELPVEVAAAYDAVLRGAPLEQFVEPVAAACGVEWALRLCLATKRLPDALVALAPLTHPARPVGIGSKMLQDWIDPLDSVPRESPWRCYGVDGMVLARYAGFFGWDVPRLRAWARVRYAIANREKLFDAVVAAGAPLVDVFTAEFTGSKPPPVVWDRGALAECVPSWLRSIWPDGPTSRRADELNDAALTAASRLDEPGRTGWAQLLFMLIVSVESAAVTSADLIGFGHRLAAARFERASVVAWVDWVVDGAGRRDEHVLAELDELREAGNTGMAKVYADLLGTHDVLAARARAVLAGYDTLT
jgi:hypothetical protein